jgi:hypothetical protein
VYGVIVGEQGFKTIRTLNDMVAEFLCLPTA